MASILASTRKKTIFYWVTIGVLFVLFVAFLSAFIKERNSKLSENDSEEIINTTQLPTTVTTPPLTEDDLRLSGSILPVNYQLKLTSDHENNAFNGSVLIDLNVVQDNVDQIKIHCKNLQIQKYKVQSSNGDDVEIKSFSIDPLRELCVLDLNNEIPKASYKLLLEYSGSFKKGQITGFYKSSYVTLDNQVRFLTATKFEPTYARMAFPCFDEPKFKATFEISIIHPSSMHAISNEIETKTVPFKAGWSETSFAKTVPMSTYLVAFVVSDFDYTETRTTFGTRVRVYSRPDQCSKTKYALDAAAEVLRYYENYTNIRYPMQKLDLIGLPEFVSGAMENWGLITYKETYVLYSETESSAADMLKIAGVVSHEVSHMWFGNLVSIKWWNDLWLNEGYASFMEYKGQDVVNKSWHIFDRFLIGDLHSGIRADSLQSASPLVNNDVLDPNQITAMFNTITYSKGASILFMLEDIIGKDSFQNNVIRYLQDHQNSVVDSKIMIDYFSDSIKLVTGVEGDLFMKKWIYSNGFPIISVKRISESQTDQNNYLEITQSIISSNDSIDEPWNIHVSYLLPYGKAGSFVVTQTSQKVNLDHKLSKNDWFKLNLGGKGFYIVNYETNDWELLFNELKSNPTTFSNTDRANIIFDAYRLSDASLLPYEQLFSLFDYLKYEKHYLPWSVSYSAISSLFSKLNGLSSTNFQNYIRDLISDVYDSNVDFSMDTSKLTYEEISLRNNLFAIACSVEYKKCADQAYKLFQDWLNNAKPVDPEIRSNVYKYGLKFSKEDSDWQSVWNMYLAEKDAIEKSKLMGGLTSTKNPNLLSLLISYSDDQDIINNENFFSVQQSIASNSDVGRGLVWDYIKQNWKNLVQRFTLNDRRLGNYVKSVISGFSTMSRLAEIEDFFAKYPNAGAGESARVEALETVQNNIKWLDDNQENISKILDSKDIYSKPWLNWRLDVSIKPMHYNVELNVDVDNESFNGNVSIDINIQKPIKYLILHIKDLQINSSGLFTKDNHIRVSSEKNNFAYEKNQFWIISMENIISPGLYVAELSFNGALSTSLSGLYLSKYSKSPNNQVAKLATTQFEAIYARKAFPCFDEPQFKATFSISVKHRSYYSSISNMNIDYIKENNDGFKTTIFKKSVKMSSYLVALVVSDFVSKQSSTYSNFSVYTYNEDNNLKKVEYALSVGPKLLDYFGKDYFKIDYPLPKMDLISIPDFSMGAMENWGLITFRDVYLLYDELETSSASKMAICSIIAHEISHMWFGNLVTINWWDELWLNEGFAQFMMYKSTAVVEPSWNYNDHFVIKELSRVYETDSSLSTHSILTMVKDENAIQSVFDPVTYAKGASIIRMLEYTIGEDKFQTAITNYLKKYSYQNTLTNDLWNEFEKVSPDTEIKNMMNNWVSKEGFPVVTVVASSNILKLKQERFLKDFNYSNSSYFWIIPISYRIISSVDYVDPVNTIYLKEKEIILKDIEIDPNNLIKFNVDQKGVYVVNYDLQTWQNYIKLLKTENSVAWKKLSPLDRNNLIMDAFYLARSGRLSYEITLELVQFLKYEQSFIVWQTASDMIRYVRNFAISQDKGIAFNFWLEQLITPLYNKLGWTSTPQEDLNTKQLRALILDLACMSKYEPCLKEAITKFEDYMNNVDSKPDPDIFSTFLYHTMSSETSTNIQKYFEFLEKKYSEAKSTNEKMRFLRALTAIQDANLLNGLINKSLDTNFLRSQDFFTFLHYLSNNPVGLELGWNFYRNNYQKIVERYGLDDSNLGRAVYRFATYFNNQKRRQEVLDFYTKYPDAGAGELYRHQAIELIDANLAWSTRFYSTVIQHLTSFCDEKVCPWKIYRLNKDVVPIQYDISIQVNTTTNLYNGTVQINVKINSEVDYIILHASSILNVYSPSVKTKQNTIRSDELAKDNGFRYLPMEFYVIPLQETISSGDYIIELSFNGSLLLGGTVGLYRGWYEGKNGTVNIAATQLESTHARKVFPCFDEPSFKQVFNIEVIHDKNMNTTLSNMPILNSNPHATLPDIMVTKYEQTVKMTTYLIAILVSDFKCSSVNVPGAGANDNLFLRTCASSVYPEEKHKYSLEVTPKIIKHYEDILDMKYKLTKMDQIALPQFSPGAMENWGLLKYREKMLLWTDDQDTASEQRSVCSVIAHEVSHMWFGNLVTCDFWGDLWLNEAFASYMEYTGVDTAHPEWKYWDLFAYYDTFYAILGDSLNTSQPIVRDVISPSLMAYSSNIVYNKGSTILKMFNSVMTNELFYNAIKQYLKDYEFTNAKTENLLSIFEKYWKYSDQIKATDFMNSWLIQPGFPYVNITYDTNLKKLKYCQQRFLQNGANIENKYVYNIPFSFYTENGEKLDSLKQTPIQFLTENCGDIDQTSPIIKVNPDFNGFYIVNYDESMWNELIDKMVSKDLAKQLTVNDRSELILSAFLLANEKLTSYLTPFKLFNYLVHENHFVPWYFYQYSISKLAHRLSRTEYRESFNQFERRLTSAQYTNIEFWNDKLGTNVEKSFRQLLITLACRSENEQCLKDSYSKFVSWKNNNELLPPNLRNNILNYGIKSSKNLKDDSKFVWDKYLKEKDSSPLKLLYLQALSFIPDPNLLENYIDLSLNENLVSVKNFVSFFSNIIDNYMHEKLAWNYFVKNFAMFSRKLTSTQMDSIISKFATYVTSMERQQEILAFLERNSKVISPSTRKSALKTGENNLQWMDDYKKLVGEWLSNNACGDNSPQTCPWSSLRIDGKIKPTKYNINIQVDLKSNKYNGSIDITLNATGKFENILLHSASMLSVDFVSLTKQNSMQNVSVAKMFRYQPNDYIVLKLDKTQESGLYVLSFNFCASLLDAGLSGLYLSNYSENGQNKKIASTQLQFYDARKVFPCFDEPIFKSTFEIAIIHDADMNTTLSNMEIESKQTLSNGLIRSKFKNSKKMSTYIVGMLISDFVCINNDLNNIKYGVCASRVQQHKMDYALEKAPIIVEELQKILAVKYPLEKIDILAIPDFYYGAMENWGMLTFRESALLYHESDTTSASKMSILKILAHEISHFWFGDIVTCEWWDDLWLNEAFATYMQYPTVNAGEPDWKYDELFLMNDFEPAINADSVDSAHPIIRSIKETRQIDQFSSSIIYSKGSSILRMLEFVMSKQKFYDAIKEYLQTNLYKNVQTKNLFDILDKYTLTDSSTLKISQLLSSWVKRNGFPYINMVLENGKYKLSQKRFLINSNVSSNNELWNVPISFYSNSKWDESKITFLTSESNIFPEIPTDELIKINAGHKGFYLVNYTSNIWENWIDALVNNYEKTNLPVDDRAGLLLDSFYLSKGNLLSYNVPLNLAKYLINEEHITPWTIAIQNLNMIRRNVIYASELGEQFKSYLKEIISPIYDKLGWDDNKGSDVTRRLRSNILDFACRNQVEDCLAKSSEQFDNWKTAILNNKPSLMPKPNLLPTILKYGLNSSEDWLFIWSQYLNENSVTLKQIYMSALVNTQDQELINMLLNKALEHNVIRSQDIYSVFISFANSDSQKCLEILWQFYQNNYERLASSLRPTHLSSLLNTISKNYFFTTQRKAEVQSFFSKQTSLGLTNSQRKDVLNTIEENIYWVQNRMKEIENFLLCGSDNCPITSFRLNPKIRPLNYELFINVYLSNDSYTGEVQIDLNVTERVLYLILHASSSLKVNSSSVMDKDKNLYEIEKEFAYSPLEFWVLKMKSVLEKGTYLLNFKFESKLSTDMFGLYKSEYYDPNQKKMIKLASTQLQDIYARRVFPCFDEPAFKSEYHLTLRHRKELKSIANMKMQSEITNDDGFVTKTFHKTPIMNSYLLAFVVSDFKCRANDMGEYTVSVCSSPPEYDKTSYTLETAPKLIAEYQKKFNYNYTLDKMDLVALPDFSAGAMENWGLLTFRETALLWDEQVSSASDKMRVISVVAHEISHMWFGDLVTCEFWSHLWLNEAFASYLEWFAVDLVEPSWNYTQLFYITDYISGMNADSSATAHPLIREVNSPSEIPYISNIIYQKGSSILRMFEFVLSENKFYGQLQKYLKKYEFKNVISSNLIEMLSEINVTDLYDTKKFIESWTIQAGFPYLNLIKKDDHYEVVQKRFFANGDFSNNDQIWIVPLSYYKNYSVSSDYGMVFLNKTNTTINIISEDLPLKFNFDSRGFYIVNYDIEDWKKWTNLFSNSTVLSTLHLTSQDYSNILYDAFTLSKANLLPYSISFKLTSILKHNEMLSVWSTGSTIFSQLWPYFRTNDASGTDYAIQKEYRKFAVSLVQNLYNKYKLTNLYSIDVSSQRLHSTITAFACAYGLDICLLESQVEFKNWRLYGKEISPNVLSTVLRYAIQESNDVSDWHYLFDVYKSSTSTSMKLNYLQGLAQSSNEQLLRLLLDEANDQSIVRRQDYLSLYNYILRTSTGYKVGWNYFKENYDYIAKNRLSRSQLGTLVNYFANYIYTQQQKQELEQFLATHPGISSTNLNKAYETIARNIDWVKQYKNQVLQYLTTAQAA